MILKHLRLRNFRRYAELMLEFPENVIGIIGRNGAGKSTLLEAIGWALYGSYAARTEKPLMRRQHAPASEPCEVELAFAIAGEDYRVVRSIRGVAGNVEAALYHAGQPEPIALRETGVNDEIAHVLGLDRKSFEVSIFAKQKELAALSSLPDEKRQKLISRLIALEAIDLARQKVSAEALQKRKFLEGARAHQANLDELQKQLDMQLGRCEAAQQTLRAQQNEEQRVHVALEKARALLEEETQRRDRFNRLNAEMNTLLGQLHIMRQQYLQQDEQKRDLLAQQVRIAELQPMRMQALQLKQEKATLEVAHRKALALKGKREIAENLANQTLALQADVENLKQQLEPLRTLPEKEQETEKRWLQAQSEVQQYREEEKRLLAILNSIETRGRDLKEKKQRVSELGADSPCPVCTRPLREHFATVVAEFERTLADLRAEYQKHVPQKKEIAAELLAAEQAEAALQNERRRLSAERSQLHAQQERMATQLKRLSDLQAQALALQREVQESGVVPIDEARLREVGAALELLEKKVQELTHLEGRVASLPALEARLVQLQDKVRQLNARHLEVHQELDNLQYHEEVFSNHKHAFAETQAAHSRSQKLVGDAQAALAAAEADMRHLERALEQARERAAAIAQTQHEVNLLETLQEYFKEFRVELAGRLRPLIAARASEILRLATNGRYTLLDLDESYNIFLYDQNQRFELQRFSGGEQDLLNLCLRVAISQVIAQRSGRPPLQFIVLDEVFGSQDEERKLLLLSTLQHLTSYFRQVFLITHEQSIKDSLPVVFEVEMVGELSEVKVR
ncbi:SMC family ATPase [candidate division KSB1 bacterium]|nr:SMC family ATPase [candidate division KSB1 bacterium]